MKGIKFEHESYGMIDISRRSGGDRKLFGSDVKHNNKIAITISQAELSRSLNTDWYFPKDDIIEIELSPVQFAEAISNMNTSGVPCTIRRKGYERVEPVPDIIDKKELFREEFKESLSGVVGVINRLCIEMEEKISNKKNITVADKKSIYDGLFKIKQQLTDNIPYMTKCFDEQLEKSEAHSKSEIEAYIQYKINSLGLKALKENETLELEEGI